MEPTPQKLSLSQQTVRNLTNTEIPELHPLTRTCPTTTFEQTPDTWA